MTIFISPPFGNYINLPETKSIKGSYTLKPRGGLIFQILKTLRLTQINGEYHWINKIGLRNRGIDYGLQQYNHQTDVLSIAILEPEEIDELNKKIPPDVNLEINVSCPNAEKEMTSGGVEVFLNPERDWCCLKLSPLISLGEVDRYYNEGFRQFHCCNTYPSEKGGISGEAVKPHSEKLVKYISEEYPDCQIVAGGGIYGYHNLVRYQNLGATHFSVSTLFFNPVNTFYFFHDYYFSLLCK